MVDPMENKKMKMKWSRIGLYPPEDNVDIVS
jgi:hypothetical protein